MAKAIVYGLVIWYLFCGCNNRISQDPVTNTTTLPSVIGNQDPNGPSIEEPDDTPMPPVKVPDNATNPLADNIRLQEIYLSQLHVRELTGNNDGKDVEKYLKSVGFGKGYAWCAAFVHWCLATAKIPNTVTAWSPTAENRQNLVFKLREFKKEPQPGDVITLYYQNLGRIGHTGFYNKRISDTTIESVEGNTNSQGSREGSGVYKKYRPINSIYSISRWTKLN